MEFNLKAKYPFITKFMETKKLFAFNFFFHLKWDIILIDIINSRLTLYNYVTNLFMRAKIFIFFF